MTRKIFKQFFLALVALFSVTFALTTLATADIGNLAAENVDITFGTTVDADLPAGSLLKLNQPGGAVYPLHDSTGKLLSRGIAGDASTAPSLTTDQIKLDVQSGNVYYQVLPDSWLQSDSTVTLLDSTGQAPTDPVTLTLKFIDANGKEIQDAKTFDAQFSATTDATTLATLETELLAIRPAITGYDLVSADKADHVITYHYAKPTISTGSTTVATQPSDPVTTTTSTPAKTEPVAVKGTAIYATKKIGLYTSPNFSKATRKIWYQKKQRQNRPQFVVISYAKSRSGQLRYKIRDINHHSLTNNRRGYITANAKYVTNLYYHQNPKKIRVVSSHGLNAYQSVTLHGRKFHHYRKGTTLKVKAVKTHGLTTRLVLSNGHYVTANKTMVIKR